MSLADSLTAATDAGPRPHPNAGCTVGKFIEGLNETDATALRTAIADNTVPPLAVYKAMHDEGFAYGSASLYRHRNLKCQCGVAGLA